MKLIKKYTKTAAIINLENLVSNYEEIKKRVNPCKVMAVIKANAYGHGALQIAGKLADAGVDFFAVARMNEAIELLRGGIKEKILIFGRLFPEEIEKSINEDIRITLTCKEDIEIIDKLAEKLAKPAKIHINVDTGMGRVGIFPENAIEIIREIAENTNFEIEGIYSHFSTSDEKDKSYAIKQLETFNHLLDQIDRIGIEIPYIHIANSGAMLDIPESYRGKYNMVRAGIILYGYYPSMETSESIFLRQVMTLRTKVLELRALPKGYSVSYGRRFITPKAMTIAVLPIGYADGIHRTFTNNVIVMIKGKLYPIVGTVTMDQIMIIVDHSVKVGDEVVFWGESENGIRKASRVAEQAGTISYELCTSVSERVPRIYKKQ